MNGILKRLFVVEVFSRHLSSVRVRFLSAVVLAFGISTAIPVSAYADDKLQDCQELAGKYGADNVWFGHVAGIPSTSPTNPLAAMNCFRTEAQCRVWLLKSFPKAGQTNSVVSCS
jgi:hypothetical protein